VVLLGLGLFVPAARGAGSTTGPAATRSAAASQPTTGQPTTGQPTTGQPSTGQPTTSAATKATRAAAKPTPTTAPRPRLGGDGVSGFDRLTRSDWPHPHEVVIVRPRAATIGIWRTTADAGPRLRFDDRKTVYGKLALLAVDRRDGFWRVALPVRPNGTTGWVREEDVVHEVVTERIVIELDTNILRLYRRDRVVLSSKAATGTGGTPTPQGLFFVKELVPQEKPNGAYGPVALGLSGFSEALKKFAGGSAIIAIHGTNSPGSIGNAASHGCIRLPNDVITELSSVVRLGTPVEIVRSERDLPSSRRRFLRPTDEAGGSPPVTADPRAAIAPFDIDPATAADVEGAPSTTLDPALTGP
jgi:hypothetical protein